MLTRLGPLVFTLVLVPWTWAQTDTLKSEKGSFTVHPIQHATMVLSWAGKTIYVDPVGGAKPFAKFPRPDLILITDIHGRQHDIRTRRRIEPLDCLAECLMERREDSVDNQLLKCQ